MAKIPNSVALRNIVYHIYGDMIKERAAQGVDKLDSIVNEIVQDIRTEGYTTKWNSVRDYVLEIVLDTYGVQAFGVKPFMEPVPESRPVTVILNELVEQGVLSKHWRTA